MIYTDKIYGRFEITEQVIVELINCPSLQRLKGVDQAGYPKPYFVGSSNRFEHSLGVFLLLKKYNAPIEEQVAGLIHDVSHFVFSHCIDYTLDENSEKEHNYQDSILKDFIRESEISGIIEKYNLNLNTILDDQNFPLKEKNLPDLCADRIDYSLRDAFYHGDLIKKDKLKYILDNLITIEDLWVFRDFQSARAYAGLFYKLNTCYYAGINAAVMFTTTGTCLKYSLEKRYITKEDIHTTDSQVLSKIRKHLNKDKKLMLLFNRMNNLNGFTENKENYDAHVFCKSRIVDPLVIHNKNLRRLSDKDKDWVSILKSESKPKEYFIRFNS